MVACAFIFVAVVLLTPILFIVGVIDPFIGWLRPDDRARRGFEVIHPTEKP
jgi:hypothetical protein